MLFLQRAKHFLGKTQTAKIFWKQQKSFWKLSNYRISENTAIHRFRSSWWGSWGRSQWNECRTENRNRSTKLPKEVRFSHTRHLGSPGSWKTKVARWNASAPASRVFGSMANISLTTLAGRSAFLPRPRLFCFTGTRVPKGHRIPTESD